MQPVVTDLKPHLQEPRVLEVLALSASPDPERLERTRQMYRERQDWLLYGLELDGRWVGLIGLEHTGTHQAIIKHISVHADAQGRGYGRQLIEEVMGQHHLQHLEAETDLSAVGFYRACGFHITSLGEKYPGTERFHCVLERSQP